MNHSKVIQHIFTFNSTETNDLFEALSSWKQAAIENPDEFIASTDQQVFINNLIMLIDRVR